MFFERAYGRYLNIKRWLFFWNWFRHYDGRGARKQKLKREGGDSSFYIHITLNQTLQRAICIRCGGAYPDFPLSTTPFWLTVSPLEVWKEERNAACPIFGAQGYDDPTCNKVSFGAFHCSKASSTLQSTLLLTLCISAQNFGQLLVGQRESAWNCFYQQRGSSSNKSYLLCWLAFGQIRYSHSRRKVDTPTFVLFWEATSPSLASIFQLDSLFLFIEFFAKLLALLTFRSRLRLFISYQHPLVAQQIWTSTLISTLCRFGLYAVGDGWTCTS